jgi:intracellular sulfur oxidation DsrE/DsrF family protein
MQYGNNFFNVNRDDYGLSDPDLAVIIVARHFSTPFAFNDAMWEKYGTTWSQLSRYTDPQTNEAPTINVYYTRGAGPGGTLAALFDRGMKVALCSVATRAFTNLAAQQNGLDADDVFNEVMDNLLDGVVPVPAGIVAVNRAQERGYTFSFTA